MKNPFKRRKKKSTAQVLVVGYAGQTVEFPLCWEKTTLKQFVDFYEANSVRSMLEAFASDIDVLHTLMGSEEAQILDRMEFRHEVPDFIRMTVPRTSTTKSSRTTLANARCCKSGRSTRGWRTWRTNRTSLTRPCSCYRYTSTRR